jgi:hypothetical protein
MALLAQIGPLTRMMESLATAIGAGMLLGAFAAGAAGVVRGMRREKLERHALVAGYLGGIVGVFLASVDLAVRYA